MLVDPSSGRPAPAATVLRRLLAYVTPALQAGGDQDVVDELVAALLSRGNGATRQRAVLRRTGDLRAVVRDAIVGQSDRSRQKG